MVSTAKNRSGQLKEKKGKNNIWVALPRKLAYKKYAECVSYLENVSKKALI